MAITNSFNAAVLLSVNDDDDTNAVATSRDAAGAILVNGGAVPVEGGTPKVANINLIKMFGLGGSDTLSLDETNEATLATTPLAREQ